MLSFSFFTFSKELIDFIPASIQTIVKVDKDKLFNDPVTQELLAPFETQIDSVQGMIQQFVGLDLKLISTFWFLSDKKDSSVLVGEGFLDVDSITNTMGKMPNVEQRIVPGILFVADYDDDETGKEKTILVFSERYVVMGDREVTGFLAQAWLGKTEVFTQDNKQLSWFNTNSGLVVATILCELGVLPDMDPNIALYAKGLAAVVDTNNETLEVKIIINTAHEDHAKAIVGIAENAIVLVKDHPNLQAGFIQKILTNVIVSADGKDVRLNIIVTQEEILSLLQEN